MRLCHTAAHVNGRRALIAAATALAGALALGAPSAHAAGSYSVSLCRDNAGNPSAFSTDWLSPATGGSNASEGNVSQNCQTANGAVIVSVAPKGINGDGANATAKIRSPAGTTLDTLTSWRFYQNNAQTTGTQGGFTDAVPAPSQNHCDYFGGSNCTSVGSSSPQLGAQNISGGPVFNAAHVSSFGVPPANEADFFVSGENPSGAAQSTAFSQLALYRIQASIIDPTAPTFSSLSGLSTSPVQGTITAAASASDAQSGVYLYRVVIDDKQFEDIPADSNGGRCVLGSGGFFPTTAPCVNTSSASIPIDTTKLANGQHKVVITVYDAANNPASANPSTITVNNPPPPQQNPQAPSNTAPGPVPGGSGTQGGTFQSIGGVGRLNAAWLSNRKATATVNYGAGASLIGTLVGPDGQPLANTPLTVAALPKGDSRATVATAKTDVKGDFRIKISGRTRPQTITLTYANASGGKLQVSLKLEVRGKLSLKASPKHASRRSGVRFTGRLYGQSAGRRVVELQVLLPHHHSYQTFRTVKTTKAGLFKAHRRFTSKSKLRFRARARAQTGWAYQTGVSRSTSVSVR